MIRRVETLRFRNLEPVDLELAPGALLVVGPTGAGKTSLLEACYVATTTRSFRTRRLEDCVRAELTGAQRSFRVKAEIDGRRRSTVEVAWSAAAGLQRAADGECGSIAEHLERQAVLVFSWEDEEIWVGAPMLRRRFVDRGLVAERTAALDALSRYRKVLSHKRSLLARPRCRRADLEPWNELLAEAAAVVIGLRSAYVTRLGEALGGAIQRSGLRLPEVSLVYRPSVPERGSEHGALASALQRVAEQEIAGGRPLFGPHRDAVELRFRNQPLARVASSGERKALALLCVAAQAELLEAACRHALVLLDDADAQLDQPTLEGVWRAFQGAPQILLSTNRPEVWQGVAEITRLRLSKGRVVGL